VVFVGFCLGKGGCRLFRFRAAKGGFAPLYPPELSVSKLEHRLKDFEDFCKVDLDLNVRTARDHYYTIRKLLAWQKAQGYKTVSILSLREYLRTYLNNSKCTRANQIKSFRRFFRDYLGVPQLIATFRLPRVKRGEIGKRIELGFTKTDLKRIHEMLGRTKNPIRNQALFLLYATTGLRRGELLEATPSHINREIRSMILDICRGTKRTGVTFYNEEAENALITYLDKNPKESNEKLFRIQGAGVKWVFVRASKQCRIEPPITPQALRVWFSYEMGRLGVPDRYIDIFQGRAPKSVLAQFYTPRGIQELKEIYDKAGLKVLS
jgi:integrase